MTVEQHGERRGVRAALVLAACAALCTSAAFAGAPHGDQLKARASNDQPPNPDCTLIVPPNPLTAQGLATPYQLTATDANDGPCNETNTAQSAFVEAAV